MDRETRRHLEVLFGAGAVGHLSDAQLLERFLRGREVAEAAFAALVERHGPLVLRVCRRVLSDPNDAHDAFQATFLALVRKAGSIRKRDSVGSWLVGVAFRVARRSRVDAARRRKRESEGASRASGEVEPVALGAAEGVPELLEEIGRLPESFRRPVVLCYLEGLSTEEAARSLGCPRGTVLSRLARARERLREGLVRRGVSLGVAIRLEAIRPATTPGVPGSLVASTVASAMATASGRGSGLLASGLRLGGGSRVAPWLFGLGVLALVGGVSMGRPRSPDARDAAAVASLTEGLVRSFGVRGMVVVHPPGEPTRLPPSLALQADGKILVITTVGRFGDSPRRHVLARYRADGRLDEGFGQGGFVAIGLIPPGIIGEPPSRPRVAVQRDGRIVVAADAGDGPSGRGKIGVQRLRPDGTSDATFGEGGVVLLPMLLPAPGGGRRPAASSTSGLAIQRDGRIVLGSTVFGTNYAGAPEYGTPDVGEVFGLARLLPDGTLDREFGDGGRVWTGWPEWDRTGFVSWAHATDLAIGPGGRIAQAGFLGSMAPRVAVLCVHDASGRLDPSFGTGGGLVLGLAGRGPGVGRSETWAGALTFAPDGSVLVAGSAATASGARWLATPDGWVVDDSAHVARAAVWRLDPTGRLDPSFGDRGVALAGPGEGRAIALDHDGKILVGGSSLRVRDPVRDLYRVDPDSRDFLLARFLLEGSPDPAFGLGGRVRSSLGDEDAIAGLVPLPDGSAIVLGESRRARDGLRVSQVLMRHRGS